jgi:cbb3-type cytochrome oxidase subunit 1
MGIKFIKVASVYLIIGTIMGMWMSISHNFTLSSAHSHILLLGWEILVIAGIIYTLFPKISKNTLAKAQFWLNNISLPIFFIGVILIDYRPSASDPANTAFVPISAIGGALTTIAYIIFVANIFLNLKNTAAEK